MRTKDMISEVARQTHMTVAEVTAVYNVTADVVERELREGRDTIVPGIVRLSTKVANERTSYNAMLGRDVVYAGGTKVIAKAVKELREAVK